MPMSWMNDIREPDPITEDGSEELCECLEANGFMKVCSTVKNVLCQMGVTPIAIEIAEHGIVKYYVWKVEMEVAMRDIKTPKLRPRERIAYRNFVEGLKNDR